MISEAGRTFIENCIKADTERDKGLTTPDDIERFDDILYGEDSKWQIMDVYRPKNFEGKLPVIVSSHGGGWVYGSKEVYQFYCMSLAQRGFAVVNYSYRLAPEFKYPAAIEDTNLVYTWIMANGEAYDMDVNNIFALGDSAGAQIAGIYAAILTNPAYAANYSFKTPEGLKISALGLNCGKYYVRPEEPDGFWSELMPEAGTVNERRLISVVHHIKDNYPPCYIFTSNGDFLKDEPKALTEALDKAGVEYESVEYGTKDKMLYHVFHCNIKSEDAKKANDEECAFFKKYIK
ncbi:MAG: alpha/beta hydrolase [Lachnospiraceae bacterium]|nr:alpha/beta hydrolase [Lachnospiraceae bacterium]